MDEKISNERLCQIINNVLVEISRYADMDRDTYMSWLKTEVGISDKEIEILNDDGYFPMPMEYGGEER